MLIFIIFLHGVPYEYQYENECFVCIYFAFSVFFWGYTKLIFTIVLTPLGHSDAIYFSPINIFLYNIFRSIRRRESQIGSKFLKPF